MSKGRRRGRHRPHHERGARHQGKRWARAVKAAVALCGLGLVVGAAGVAAHALLGLLYGATASHPWPIVDEALTSVLSFFIVGLLFGTIGYFSAKRQSHDFLGPLIEAMRQIARGNFEVTVPTDLPHRNAFAPVATGLSEMTESLKVMESMRQEFIANVSHEIQSPLTSISGFAHALGTTEVSDAERKDYLAVIESEAKRLSRLSEDLLQLTSLDSIGPGLRAERFNLSRQLREVIVAFDPQIRARSLAIDAVLEELWIIGDQDKLHRVWANLLSNAIKFSTEGDAIEIRLTSTEDSFTVTVHDDGIGVSGDDLPFLFDRFFKADRSRPREGARQGSGLGLAIVKRVVELHHGRVAVSSDGNGKGTSFEVELPLRSEEQ